MSTRLESMQRDLQSFANAPGCDELRQSVHLLPLPDFTGYEGVVAVTSPTSPWFGGVFQFWILTPTGYPRTPPTVRFAEDLRHPSLDDGFLDVADLFDEQEAGPSHPLLEVATRIRGLFDLTISDRGGSEILENAHNDVADLSALPPTVPDAAAMLAAFSGDHRTWCLEAQARPLEATVHATEALTAVTREQMITDRLLTHVVPRMRK